MEFDLSPRTRTIHFLSSVFSVYLFMLRSYTIFSQLKFSLALFVSSLLSLSCWNIIAFCVHSTETAVIASSEYAENWKVRYDDTTKNRITKYAMLVILTYIHSHSQERLQKIHAYLTVKTIKSIILCTVSTFCRYICRELEILLCCFCFCSLFFFARFM